VSPSSPDCIDLARGTVNGLPIIVQLVRERDLTAAERTLKPTHVGVIWPPAPSVIDARLWPVTAAQLTKLFAESAVALAAVKARLGTPL
jgi:hypothetical protein